MGGSPTYYAMAKCPIMSTPKYNNIKSEEESKSTQTAPLLK